MRPGLWLTAGVTALAAIVAIVAILVLDPYSWSSGDGNVGESSLQKTLRKMVLQPGDVPEGLELGEESFLTNEDTASKEPDPEARRQLLDQWGRLLGFEIAYRPAEGEVVDSVRGINASSSLYETEDRTHLHPTVESWLRTLVGNVRAALPDSGAENGG